MEKIPPVANPQPIPVGFSHRAVRRPVNGLLAIFEAEIDVKSVGWIHATENLMAAAERGGSIDAALFLQGKLALRKLKPPS